MYDEIICEHPLPKTGYKLPEGHDGWQTEDLENLLNRYTITADGRLVLHQVRYEDVPEQERPYYGTPAWDGPFGGWVGSLRSVPAGDEEVPHHGDVRFYNAFRIEGGEGRVWIEFKARFTEGRLSRIKVENVHDLPPTKTLEIGGGRFTAAESGLGFEVIKLGEEPEVKRDEYPQHHQTRRSAELAALYRHLSDTFDDREAARAWLETPNRYLGGQTPEEAVRNGRPDRAEAALEALDSGTFL